MVTTILQLIVGVTGFMLTSALFYQTMSVLALAVSELFDKLREPVKIMVSNPPYVLLVDKTYDVYYLLAHIGGLLIVWGFLFTCLVVIFAFLFLED